MHLQLESEARLGPWLAWLVLRSRTLQMGASTCAAGTGRIRDAGHYESPRPGAGVMVMRRLLAPNSAASRGIRCHFTSPLCQWQEAPALLNGHRPTVRQWGAVTVACATAAARLGLLNSHWQWRRSAAAVRVRVRVASRRHIFSVVTGVRTSPVLQPTRQHALRRELLCAACSIEPSRLRRCIRDALLLFAACPR
jgi:hypothetical protein